MEIRLLSDMETRVLSDHRKDLVAGRTRAQHRLRWHLLKLCPSSNVARSSSPGS
jgi:hypothetical protein